MKHLIILRKVCNRLRILENDEIVNSLDFFGAYEGDELRGVIAVDEQGRHICCFFVKAQYHRQGIGRTLWEHVMERYDSQAFTVNSSPYAVGVYHRLGFEDTDSQQLTDGMIYTPMKFKRK